MTTDTTEKKHYFLVRPEPFSIGVDLLGRPAGDVARDLAENDVEDLLVITRGQKGFTIENLTGDERDEDVLLTDAVITALYHEWGRISGEQVWDTDRAEKFVAALDRARALLVDREQRPRCGVCGEKFDGAEKCRRGCAEWQNGHPELASRAVSEWVDG